MTRPYLKHLARVLRTVPEGSKPVPAIPDDFPEPDLTSGGVSPTAAYVYHNADGRRAFVVKRTETSKGKQILPLSVWQTPEGMRDWYAKALPVSRPLYRLADVLDNPGKTVLISEGEKCADAAAAFTSWASVTWSGGCKAISKTDFSPLADRSVLILPDLDDAGATAADTLISVLKEVGAVSVRRLDMRGLAERCGYEAESGFDIADAIALGLEETRFSQLLEDPAVLAAAEEVALATGKSTSTEGKLDQIQQEVMDLFGIDADKIGGPFALSSQGVIKQDVDRRGNPIDIFAGSPCVVLGRTRTDDTGPGWGFLIALRTPLEKWETVSLPARLLAGDGRELREVLAASGAIVPQDRAGRQAQAEFIGYAMHGPIVHVATRPGWHDGSFALPQGNVRAKGAAQDLMLDMGAPKHFLRRSGTMEGWRELARYAENNSRACFAISAAFAPPLLKIMDRQGNGFNFFCRSSRGKTTVLMAGGSVWGGGGKDGFVRSWRLTDNFAEALLAEHNDLLLPLDEMTAATPELVSQLNYLFANGHGKGRANRDGSARATLQSRLIVLSSGENATADQVESGRGRTRMTGGQAVRMVDIPFEYEEDHSFEDLAGFDSSGAFAEALSGLAKTHFGHAGPAFVSAIINRQAEVAQEAEGIIQMMIDSLVEEGDDPQVRRVAAQFGMVAAAASIAVDAGILPWQNTAGIKAAATCFRAWKEMRGGGGSHEEMKALKNLKAFFELHGRTRFERISGSDDGQAEDVPSRAEGFAVRDRCGYFEEREDQGKGPLYYILPEAFRNEVCGDHNTDLVLRIARKHGALHHDKDGRRWQKNKRLPDFPQGKKVYVLEPDQLP